MKNFKPSFPCPVCGGHERMSRGEGKRCHGFMSTDGRYAHCTREEAAGGLAPDPKTGKFVHFLDGTCKCAAGHVTATAMGTYIGHLLTGKDPEQARRLSKLPDTIVDQDDFGK